MTNIPILSSITDEARLDIILAGTGFTHKTKACWYYWRHGEELPLWIAISAALEMVNKTTAPVIMAYPKAFTLYMVNHAMAGGYSPKGYLMDKAFYEMCLSQYHYGKAYRDELSTKYSRTRPKTLENWQRALTILNQARIIEKAENLLKTPDNPESYVQLRFNGL